MCSALVVNAIGDNLPSSERKSWMSYHAVSEGRNHTAAISMDGSLDLFFMKRSEKLNKSWPVLLKVRVERKEKSKGAKWSVKQLKKDGFENPLKQAENPKELNLVAKVTGDVKFRLIYEFTKYGVKCNAEFIGKPKDSAKADYRLILESEIDELVIIKKEDVDDDKAVKQKSKGTELHLTTRNERPYRIKFHEKVDIAKQIKDEVTEVILKAEKIGRKKLTWQLTNPESGILSIEPKSDNGKLYKGFTISTVLVDETGKRASEGITLIYK